MASLTTGLIDNPSVAGVRPTLTLTARIINDDAVTAFIRKSAKRQGQLSWRE